MPQYRLGKDYARTLNDVVGSSDFKSPEAVLRHLVQTHASGLIQRNQTAIIDPQAADNGARRTQEQWISYFNNAGKAMISAPNMYQAGKTASDEVLASLKSDFDASWLVTSTRISYSGDDLSGRVIHNYGSIVVKPSQRDVKVIPVYDSMPLAQALRSDKGIAYIHFLFDTSDEPKDIAGTLENLSKRGAERIALWTPNHGSRGSYNERAVGFYVDGGRFHVFGILHLVDFGHSRGVLMKSPRSGRAKK